MRRRYLTSREAADALGVAVSTLQYWAANKKVKPAWRTPGGQARWDLADLERQLDYPPQPQEQPMTDAAAPLRPPIVAAIVTSSKGVLITRRHDGKPLWGFVTGEAEPGESPQDTAIREVKEETTLEVKIGQVIGERNPHPATGRHMIYVAARPYQGTTIHVGDENELAEVKWASLAEAEDKLVGMFEPVHAHLKRTLR
jgi:8-oxo-dGTP pyrophosphatase MutT (NUDIX family)